MLIAVGKDTKKIDQLVGLDKVYIAFIDFSQKTDTRDSDYWKDHETFPVVNNSIVMGDKTIEAPDQSKIVDLLDSIIGTHLLPLTPFSARKRKGKKLYEYART
jgi:tRNA U55 pseudouridine synthase TruB